MNILNNMLELLFSSDIGPIDNDIRDIMLILLRTIIQSSIAMDRDNPLVGNLVSIMLAIFRSMNEAHYRMYMNNFNTRFDLQDFLTEILLVFKDLVSRPVFPNDWLDMIMHQNTIILESLRNFAQIIKDKFFDPFEKQVWSNFFHCSIAFLIQPALQLDQFTENKMSKILTRYCNIRRETALEICNMWYNLGENKIIFVPQMVGKDLNSIIHRWKYLKTFLSNRHRSTARNVDDSRTGTKKVNDSHLFRYDAMRVSLIEVRR